MNAMVDIFPAQGVKAAVPLRPKLKPADWIVAGFNALVDGGPEAIKVEALARDLGATKGSFYWHFKDLRAFHAAMLEAFEQLAAPGITSAIRRGGGPRLQMMRLVEAVSALPEDECDGAALEPSMRDWSRTDPMARETLARVDARRLADLCAFLGEAGLDSTRASQGAVRFYAALLGLEALRITCGVDMRGPLAAAALAILEEGAADRREC